MNNIVMDERTFAEYALKNYELGQKPIETLGRIARYYHSNGYNRIEIVDLLEDFMIKCDPTVNVVKWVKSIEAQAKSSEKYDLIDIQGISITKGEVDSIKKISGVLLQRLMFTLLCLAKYGNAVSANNNGWVNRKDKEIFSFSNIKVGRKRQALMMNDLWSAGYIGYSRVIDNTNVNVKLIESTGDETLFVTDLRNIGNQWMKFIGGNYMECQSCGLVVKRTANGQKYCKECSVEINKQKTFENQRRSSAA